MFLKYNIWSMLWALIILYLSLSPSDHIPVISFKLSDKIMHATLYGIFQWLLLIGLYKQHTFKGVKKNHLLYAVLISVGYGILMEILQGALPVNRSCDFLDVVANVTGTLVVTAVWKGIYLRQK